MDKYQEHLLEVIADLHGIPEGAYNIRSNGQSVGRASTAHIEIEPQKDRPGINVYIKPETQHEACLLYTSPRRPGDVQRYRLRGKRCNELKKK